MRYDLCSVSRRFGSTKALHGLSLRIDEAGLVAVIGLNGAGKTTLLRLLGGILAPTSGAIRCDGEPLRRDDLAFRRRIGYLPDFPAVFADHSVLDHLAMALPLYGRDPEPEAVAALLDRLDLIPLAERPLGTLSRGQIYKAALAALVLADPEVWLLDEPFASGMDPRGISALKEAVRAAVARGRTVIYTTQILEVVERFCDRLVVIDHGELAWTADRRELEALPAQGAGSLEDRLSRFRERAP